MNENPDLTQTPVRTVALIVAAGRGTRLGGDLPKQYQNLGTKPVLAHTLAAFATHPEIDGICVVINPADRHLYDAAAQGLPKLLTPANGGAERQESVRNGLEALKSLSPQNVLIHDGARPFVSEDLIGRVIAALGNHSGAIAALPVHDTLKRQKPSKNENHIVIDSTMPREGLWQAQTPQGFRFDDIMNAHQHATGKQLTDDAAVAEQAGIDVALIEGDSENLKITRAQDLERGHGILLNRLSDIRVGQGFDVHQFAPPSDDTTHIHLCGIKVEHNQAVIGHSDADVGLHAITDAILGAISAGDIGEHFPPSDPKWKNASSDQFLSHAQTLVAQRGGIITHVDATLICERPKIGPLRPAMAKRIAEILNLAVDRVSVKATTTEKLGFTGRGEGIAAQAVATIRLPSS